MNLVELVNRYFEYRGYKDPDANAAFLFLTSEIGELADTLVQTESGWVRNNEHVDENIADEIGDVLMMLTKFAEKVGVDPVEAMINKWKRKGWRDDL